MVCHAIFHTTMTLAYISSTISHGLMYETKLVTLATIAVTAPSLAKLMYWFTVCTNIKASMINTIVTLAIEDTHAIPNKDKSKIKSKTKATT